MTKKQKTFCDVYAIDFNFKEACIVAGVSESYGTKCLNNPECIKYISMLNDRASERVGLSKQYVLSKLKTIVERCMQTEPVLVYDNITKQYVPSGEYTFNANSAIRALEIIAKHIDISDNPFDFIAGSQKALEAPNDEKVIVVDDIPEYIDVEMLKEKILECEDDDI